MREGVMERVVGVVIGAAVAGLVVLLAKPSPGVSVGSRAGGAWVAAAACVIAAGVWSSVRKSTEWQRNAWTRSFPFCPVGLAVVTLAFAVVLTIRALAG